MIGLFFWLQNPALLIWNWRTGKLVLRCEADPADEGVVPQDHPTGFPQLPPATWDFGFLSNRTYLINSIHGKGFIHIYSFDGDAEPDVAPTLWATLAMPEIQPMRTVHHFATHSAPFLAGDITSGKPFTTDENARVYMMTITYGPQMRYHIFMKSEFLESLIPKQEQLVSGQMYVPPVYQWEKWGPANTRFIENHVHYQWLRYVQGHRVVLPPLPVNPLAWPSSLYRICVLDFNVHPKRVTDPCDPYRKRSKETTYTVHNKEHAVAAKQLFTKDVMTRLPYAISTRIGVFNYSGFMIDEERLIGMKSSASSSDGDLSSIHVFTL
ncbi:hypothetical protein QCA50_017978 [Cerrena zonata]|uniref:Uncharacterized protein n=1 Tax=Cerrena zonata TaxID=2478898 RepID=A0AAW0FHN6_9APHY